MPQAPPSSKAQVKAVFEESTLEFEIPTDTPLEKLCGLLTMFGGGHGEPLLVEVSLPSPTIENAVP